MLKKLFNAASGLNLLKKTLGRDLFYQAAKDDLRLKISDQPQNFLPPQKAHAKILVLSPHADDDVFGMGGTIVKHSKAGDEVSVLYFCDGSKGTPEGIRDSSLIGKRKNEAERASKILGVKELLFWGYKDGSLTANSTSVKALKSLILENKPDIIYLPSISDNHPDHLETNKIFYQVIASFSSDSPFKFPLVAMYELWTPLFPNRLININSVIEIKKEAIGQHQSQLRSRDYSEAILALNKYRAEMNGIKGFAEAFFVVSSDIYQKLYELTHKK